MTDKATIPHSTRNESNKRVDSRASAVPTSDRNATLSSYLNDDHSLSKVSSESVKEAIGALKAINPDSGDRENPLRVNKVTPIAG